MIYFILPRCFRSNENYHLHQDVMFSPLFILVFCLLISFIGYIYEYTSLPQFNIYVI